MLVVVDVEADGPYPGDYSIVCFGAATVEEKPQTFYGEVKPISSIYDEKALSISGISREDHALFPEPEATMAKFAGWLENLGRATFISDNVAFDWQWINYYFHKYYGKNPFGFSGRRIGDIYSGATGHLRSASDWKKFRRTKHDHNPVNDALGNVEALFEICKKFNIKGL